MGVREGRSLTLGRGGPVLVDADELVASARRLREAGDGLDAADARLRGAAWSASMLPTAEAAALADAVDALRRASHGPAGLAQDLRDLAGRTQAAAAAYDLAETDAQAWWARALGSATAVVGAVPFGAAALTVAAAGVAAGPLVVGHVRDRVRDPLSPDVARDDLVRLLTTPGRLVTDGSGALVLQLLAAALASATGAAPVPLDPVQRLSGHVARHLPDRTVRLVPRVDPPDLAPPRGVGDLVDLVARTYDDATPTGEPGTPLATVTVQRLDHADGARSWVVAVPGTRAVGLTGDVPTDNGTNLALEGGVPDVMTTAVLDAMAAAGVGAHEPVAIVGHSQGGMVATTVAATGAYAVRLVVTAGSPDVPARVPSGVATVTLRHREDAVSLLDGRVGERGGPAALSVVRDLAATGGPARPSLTDAHAVAGYVRTGAMVDGALRSLPPHDPVRRALDEVLGARPPTATTTQVTATTQAVPTGPAVSPATSSAPTARS